MIVSDRQRLREPQCQAIDKGGVLIRGGAPKRIINKFIRAWQRERKKERETKANLQCRSSTGGDSLRGTGILHSCYQRQKNFFISTEKSNTAAISAHDYLTCLSFGKML